MHLGAFRDASKLHHVQHVPECTTYSYDNVGNRISKEIKKTDQNVRTNYTYNELNQLTTESEEGKSDINYSYDANGNLVSKTDG